MDSVGIVFTILMVGSIAMIIIGIPIAYVMGSITVVGVLFTSGVAPLTRLGVTPFSQFYGINWTPVPLFILMGFILAETDIGKDLFKVANNWLSRIPGALVSATIWTEGAVGAVMGASGVSIITVGKVALPEMERLGYNKRFALGALLASGPLDPLIPPSITFCIYALLARQSISELFMAGIIPGLLLAIMLSGSASLICLRRPELAPRPTGVSWKERIVSLKKVWPIVVLFGGMLGGIYMGVITATEAAGTGIVLLLIISVVFYRFSFKNLVRAMSETTTVTGMVGLMLIATMFFTYFAGASGMAQGLSSFIASSGLSPLLVIIVINLILLVLGCLMDGLAILMVTLPFLIPVVEALGLDLVWFGVLMTVNIEIGLITPPVGLNLYMISNIFHEPTSELIRGMFPFLIVLVIFLAVLIAFPALSLWLPGMMRGG